MGAYSEMEMERQYGDNLFSERSARPASGPQEPSAWDETPAVAPPAFEDDERQQAEAEAAPEILAQLNEEQDDENDGAEDSAEVPEQSKDTADDGGEDAGRKAHEEAEAKRKAEFDAKQAAKKAAERELLDRLNSMSDQDVMMESMKRVSADTEKLTRRNMKDCVSEHIQTLCLDDPAFARRVMHPGKSMVRCFWYINRKAREFVEQEMKDNDVKPENGVYGSDVPDDLCYQWAVDYFNDPDAKEDHKDEEKFVSKPYVGKTTKSKGKPKKAEPKKKDEKKSVERPKEQGASNGQMSLLGVA